MLSMSNNKGQMLVEIIVALGILSLVLIGVSDLMTRSQRIGGYQTKRDEAFNIAKDLLNDYRIQRDNDPSLFKTSVTGIDRAVCIVEKEYACKVNVIVGENEVDLEVIVSWQDGSSTLSITQNQTLSTTIQP
jgi:type II secretory pathway pseudopilin PulG